MNNRQLLNNVLAEMPDEFTSNDFMRKKKQMYPLMDDMYVYDYIANCLPKKSSHVCLKHLPLDTKKLGRINKTDLFNAFNEMNETFTSSEFYDNLRKKKYYLINKQEQVRISNEFLVKNARKINTSTYQKNSIKESYVMEKNELTPNDLIKAPSIEINEEVCISFLKKLGYKVLKPVVNYEEL